MKTTVRGVGLITLSFAAFAATATAQTTTNPALVELVTRMARIGRASSATFSPDGTRLAFVSDRTGVPQVWIATADGGEPRQVTRGEDPIGRVIWSPDGQWLAVSLAPGGGMNTQVYLVHPDGTGWRRLTDGGRDTNNLGTWTHDGRRLTIGSNRASPSAIDAVPRRRRKRRAAADFGRRRRADGGRREPRWPPALVSRLRGRGDNDLFIVDLESHTATLADASPSAGLVLRCSSRRMAAPCTFSSDEDRDTAAFARIRDRRHGSHLGAPEIIAARDDAELGDFAIDEKGTTAALLWNVAGRNELAFVDLASGRQTAGPRLPGDIAGGLTFSRDGKRLAMTISRRDGAAGHLGPRHRQRPA